MFSFYDILGNLSSWEKLFVPMEVFAIWFEKHLYRISKGHGSNGNWFWFYQVQYQLHHYF
jgi:hypothetical protein